jgi:hypothetical protein
MNKKFLQSEMMRIETNYGQDKFKITAEMFNLWWDMFKDLKEEGVKVSVTEYIKNHEYPPNIAGIMKIYTAKNEYRKHMRQLILAKYNYVCRWYEEKKTEQCLKKLINLVFSYPTEDREIVINDFALDAISYYNRCMAEGKKCSIEEFIEGYKWMQKDR